MSADSKSPAEGGHPTNSDCACLELGPKRTKRTIVRDLGQDTTQGRYAEATVVQCTQCGRLWLRYSLEYEAFSRSGRWAQGPIDNATAATITAAAASEFFHRAEWYVFGGSYYGHTGKRGRGRLYWGP